MFSYFVLYSEHDQRWHVGKTPADNSSSAYELIGPPYFEYEDAEFFRDVVVTAIAGDGPHRQALRDFVRDVR